MRTVRSILWIFLFTAFVLAQSGGTYQMEKSVISSGGGDSVGGTYTATVSIGQPAAGGFLTGTPNQAYTGFWTPHTPIPTAAGVTVSGRVVDTSGRGVRSAVLVLTDPNGNVRRESTRRSGYYRFIDVTAGQSYVISVSARRYTFAEPTQLISVTDDLTDLNFVGSRFLKKPMHENR